MMTKMNELYNKIYILSGAASKSMDTWVIFYQIYDLLCNSVVSKLMFWNKHGAIHDDASTITLSIVQCLISSCNLGTSRKSDLCRRYIV